MTSRCCFDFDAYPPRVSQTSAHFLLLSTGGGGGRGQGGGTEGEEEDKVRVMDWWHKLTLPVRQAWTAVSARFRTRKRGMHTLQSLKQRRS